MVVCEASISCVESAYPHLAVIIPIYTCTKYVHGAIVKRESSYIFRGNSSDRHLDDARLHAVVGK
jgi:hypothetical protein